MDATQVVGGLFDSLFHHQHDTQSQPFQQSSSHCSRHGLEYSTKSSTYLSSRFCFGIMTIEAHNSPRSFARRPRRSPPFPVPLELLPRTLDLFGDVVSPQQARTPRSGTRCSAYQRQSPSSIWNELLQKRVRDQQSRQPHIGEPRERYRAAGSVARRDNQSGRLEDLSSNTTRMPDHYHWDAFGRWRPIDSQFPSRRSPTPSISSQDSQEGYVDRAKKVLQEELAHGQRKADFRVKALYDKQQSEKEFIRAERDNIRGYKANRNSAYSRRVPFEEADRIAAKIQKHERLKEEAKERLNRIEADIRALERSIEIENANQAARKAGKSKPDSSRRHSETFVFAKSTFTYAEYGSHKAGFDRLRELFDEECDISSEMPRPKILKQNFAKKHHHRTHKESGVDADSRTFSFGRQYRESPPPEPAAGPSQPRHQSYHESPSSEFYEPHLFEDAESPPRSSSRYEHRRSGKGKARQRDHPRFVPQDEDHEGMQREYTSRARRHVPPEQHLNIAEARELFEEYNKRWTALDPKDPKISYPARDFRPEALKDIQSLWAPNTREDVSKWSVENVMKANAQAVFLGAVGLAPTYHEDKRGKLQLGFDVDNATAEQKKRLLSILRKELLRWHSDILANRTAGLNVDKNEVLENDKRARAVFYAVVDLKKLLEPKKPLEP